jgi:hypothetical protein
MLQTANTFDIFLTLLLESSEEVMTWEEEGYMSVLLPTPRPPLTPCPNENTLPAPV